MWLKLFGSILIVAVTSCIGFKIAARCAQRPQHIRNIISCLVALRSYISYAALPLHEALAQCTKGIDGVIKELFNNTAAILANNAAFTPSEAMSSVIKDLQERLMLEKPELEVLTVFTANLGIMDRKEQENYIDLVRDQLEKIELEAIRLRELNTKMYRYLGVCGGCAIVILLV